MAIETNSEASNPPVGDPCVMVIFGATGDLTKRKLIPALYNLRVNGLLPEQFAIIGFSSDQMSAEDFRKRQAEEIREFATAKVDDAAWKWLEERLDYMVGDFHDSAAYQRLGQEIRKIESKRATKGNVLFYLATAPRFFAAAIAQLGNAGLVNEEHGRWRRVIIEKPFGHDLESAKALNTEIKKTLQERQIYRIDHYLGKE